MKTKANTTAIAMHSSNMFSHRRTIAALMLGVSLFCLSAGTSFANTFTIPGLGKLWFFLP